MAPSTRLRAHPDRRVNYAPAGRAESGASELTISRESTRKPATRVKKGAIVKPKAEPNKSVTGAPTPKKEKKKQPKHQECSICATKKNTERSFKVPEDANACEHLESICSTCIQKMLKSKVADRLLNVAELACPFPNCDHVLDFTALRKTVTKGEFEAYDEALTKYALSAGESYIACLSEKCGKYFSSGDCKSNKRTKQMIECPYCEYKICMTCNRPWESHGSGGCSKAKAKEDRASENTVKKLGAKACPQCGVNIEKQGGCDHMTCQRCHHNFCWQCLVPYTSNMQHADECPNSQVNVVNDPRNWAGDHLDVAQVNNLIHQAHARLDHPAAHPQVHFPFPMPVGGPRPMRAGGPRPMRVGGPPPMPVGGPPPVPAGALPGVNIARAIPFDLAGALFELFRNRVGNGAGEPPNAPH